MDRSAEEMVAYALEVDHALLPFAPELLVDLDALGADVDEIVAAIGGLGLATSARVVDLGSGKGAVAIAIARDLGLSVHGIELFEPFVRIATDAAQAAGVAGRCRFTHGDIVEMARATAAVEVAVFAALGDVLGPLDVTVGIIREYVVPGGYVVINDSYRRDGSTAHFPGFASCVGIAETRRLLTAHGDEIVAEELVSDEVDEDDDDQLDEGSAIAARAAELARRHPELAVQLGAYVDAQLAEYEFLANHTIGAVWVLRRR